jgi:elongation factor Ts
MAAVSMAAVKELRERLGAGMVDSKNALVEAEGDIEKAIEILRLKGLKGVAKPAEGKTVAEVITDEAAIIGERLELRKVSRVDAPGTAVYLHQTSKDLPPQIGVVVGYEGDDAEAALSIARHISFADPLYLDREDVPEADVEKERALVTEISKNEGKPEAALPKIVEGRLTAFFKNVALNEQVHALDADKREVKKVAEAAGITVTGFARSKVGA